MKILVTGAQGQLGIACQKIFSDHTLIALGRDELDITNLDQCISVLNEYTPDVIIHAAAWTDVRKAEIERLACYEVNVTGTYNLLRALSGINSKFIFLSTDFVFDGSSSTPYKEVDALNPLNVYGRSKLAAECLVRDLAPDSYIVRTQWVFGEGKNFIKTILSMAEKQSEFSVLDDQVGSPTYALDLARWIKDIIEKQLPFGIYHAANSGSINWADYTREILRLAGKPLTVTNISTSEYQERFKDFTPKPAYSVLDTHKLSQYTEIRPWQEAVADYISSL